MGLLDEQNLTAPVETKRTDTIFAGQISDQASKAKNTLMSDSDNALDNSDVSSDTGSMDRSKPKRMPMVNAESQSKWQLGGMQASGLANGMVDRAQQAL